MVGADDPVRVVLANGVQIMYPYVCIIQTDGNSLRYIGDVLAVGTNDSRHPALVVAADKDKERVTLKRVDLSKTPKSFPTWQFVSAAQMDSSFVVWTDADRQRALDLIKENCKAGGGWSAKTSAVVEERSPRSAQSLQNRAIRRSRRTPNDPSTEKKKTPPTKRSRPVSSSDSDSSDSEDAPLGYACSHPGCKRFFQSQAQLASHKGYHTKQERAKAATKRPKKKHQKRNLKQQPDFGAVGEVSVGSLQTSVLGQVERAAQLYKKLSDVQTERANEWRDRANERQDNAAAHLAAMKSMYESREIQYEAATTRLVDSAKRSDEQTVKVLALALNKGAENIPAGERLKQLQELRDLLPEEVYRTKCEEILKNL